MPKNDEDRRVRRSRKLLKEGLLKLMHDMKFAEISARNITDLMDMNRSTFYLHFKDTQALLQSVEDDLEAEVQALIDAHLSEVIDNETLRPIFEPILDFITEKMDTCQILFDNNEASHFTERLQGLIYRNAYDVLRAWYNPKSEDNITYLLNFATYGMLGLIMTWHESGMALPKEDLINMADKVLDSSAKAILV